MAAQTATMPYLPSAKRWKSFSMTLPFVGLAAPAGPVAWSKTVLVNSGSEALQSAKAMPASSAAMSRPLYGAT